MKTLYKSPEGKKTIMALYDEKLTSLQIEYVPLDVDTSFGRTRVIKTGNNKGLPIVLFHGINAGSPLTIEAVRDLCKDHLIYAIDTVGQATQSDEKRINIMDDSYAIWADEVLDQLNIEAANCIGISYGAYILQRLIVHRPQRIQKSIFVVPSGIVNGKFGVSIRKLSIPLIRFLITKKDAHLTAFTKAFVQEEDEFMIRLQKALLLGLNMDYRRPKLLQRNEVSHYEKPVYFIVADDDIFFPGTETLQKAGEIFNNLKDYHILKNCKHIPHTSRYKEIQDKIAGWLEK
jgi:pimeloyl-ACP methyl ester carboxylesterase